MNSRELALFEKVFGAVIEGGLYQTKSKLAASMEAKGYIVKREYKLPDPHFGTITIAGYDQTVLGNALYCMSDHCKGTS